ncbi:hypothetical protein R1sor_022898 [Riccia sorocarpa]|uniref:Uncharacterized protein n=1 Tax=Riccia sorocarpa TaxID=122646 RepID=A0ABD3GP62_9MARC
MARIPASPPFRNPATDALKDFNTPKVAPGAINYRNVVKLSFDMLRSCSKLKDKVGHHSGSHKLGHQSGSHKLFNKLFNKGFKVFEVKFNRGFKVKWRGYKVKWRG